MQTRYNVANAANATSVDNFVLAGDKPHYERSETPDPKAQTALVSVDGWMVDETPIKDHIRLVHNIAQRQSRITLPES